MNPVVIKDSTDATRTFTPSGNDKGVTTFTSGTGVPIGDERLTVSAVRTANGRKKVAVKIAVPELGSTQVGASTKYEVLRTNYMELTLNYAADSTEAERREFRWNLAGLIADPGIINVIDKAEALY